MMIQLFIAGLFGSIAGKLTYQMTTQLNSVPPYYLHLKALYSLTGFCHSCYRIINIWPLYFLFELLYKKNRCCQHQYMSLTRYELLFSFLVITSTIIFPSWQEIVIFLILTIWFVILIIYDVRYYLLPDYLTCPLFFIGLLFCYFQCVPLTVEQALKNSCFIFILLWLTNVLFYFYCKKSGLGFGDVKLMAALSTWHPLIDILHILILASLSALLWIIIIWLIKRKILLKIPFGPFILFYAWIIFFGK